MPPTPIPIKDPFSMLSKPHTQGPNEPLIKLMTGEGLTRLKGAEQRRDTSLAGDIAATAAGRKGFTDLSINPDDINAEAQRTMHRESARHAINTGAAFDAARVGGAPKKIGGLSALDAFSPLAKQQRITPLAEASAAASVPGKVTEQTQKKVVGITLNAEGIPTVTTTTSTTTGSYKFSDPRALKFAREKLLRQFGNKRIDPTSITVGEDGVTRAMLDGKKVKFPPGEMFDGTE
jgi:hypothetical protein